jgi:hypothetical protein
MKAILAAAAVLLAGIVQPCGAQLVEVHGIDPRTLQAAVLVAGPFDAILFQAHYGPPQAGVPWQDLTTVSSGTEPVIQINLGNVPTNGITFRAVTPGTPPVIEIDEAYIPYPFVNTLSLALNTMSNAPPETHLGFTVLGNAYSDALSCSITGSPTVAFFRLFSTNGCPTNAVLQYSTDIKAGTWTTTRGRE